MEDLPNALVLQHATGEANRQNAAPPAQRPRFGAGVRVLYSDARPDSVTDRVTEDEVWEALDAAQLLTQGQTAMPEAEAVQPRTPHSCYWRHRLTLWQCLSEGGWLLLSQASDHLFSIAQTVIACDNALTAFMAFEQELTYQTQLGRQLTVTRTPWGRLARGSAAPGAHTPCATS